MRICLSTPNTLGYPDGGHIWVFLNWALGFKSLGHEVVWLDVVDLANSPKVVAELLETLRERLQPFGLEHSVALVTPEGKSYEYESELELMPLDRALSCDLLCDHRYNTPSEVVNAFRKSMLVDIDPGQLQIALDLGTYKPAEHTHYFTVGEWVKFKDRVPVMFNSSLPWQYTPPPVALEHWPVKPPSNDAAVTTVSNWYMANEWMPDEKGEYYDNSKRAAFQPYLNVASQSPLPLELCLNIGNYQPEIDLLRGLNWRIVKSNNVSHPQDYREYIQHSLGEFSCAKPAYVRMNTGWLSDRTACYLASGKPVIIQKTGQSDIFPDAHGMFRFNTPEEAVHMLKKLSADYASHCRAAREIAEQHLDAKKVLRRVLEQTV